MRHKSMEDSTIWLCLFSKLFQRRRAPEFDGPKVRRFKVHAKVYLYHTTFQYSSPALCEAVVELRHMK